MEGFSDCFFHQLVVDFPATFEQPLRCWLGDTSDWCFELGSGVNKIINDEDASTHVNQ